MKRYLAFVGEYIYPSGGMGDFYGDFHTLEEAKAILDEKSEWWEGKWCHVYDTKQRKEVWSR